MRGNLQPQHGLIYNPIYNFNLYSQNTCHILTCRSAAAVTTEENSLSSSLHPPKKTCADVSCTVISEDLDERHDEQSSAQSSDPPVSPSSTGMGSCTTNGIDSSYEVVVIQSPISDSKRTTTSRPQLSCEIDFATSRSLLRYKCDKCGRECPSKHKLKRHLSTHSDARPFPCKICGRSFKWSEYLQKHMRQQHPSRKKGMNRDLATN